MGTKRLWLCRICHLAQKQSSLLTINGNDYIISHLRSKHNINVGPGSYKSNIQSPIPLSPFEAATQASSTLGNGHERQPFWAAGYVQAYVDWTILQDITFRQATSAHTRALLTFNHP